MKQLKFLAAFVFSVSVSFFIFSCNSEEEKKADETAVDPTMAPKTMEPLIAVVKPANILIIQHKVASFAKWKPVYDSHDSIRLSYGLTNYVIGRGLNDSNIALVILKMADANKAKELTGSQGIKDRMKKGGIIGIPSFTYLNVVMNDSSKIEQTARIMMTHKVKDWDAWKKEFDSHKQARIDGGLIDRGVGYSVDDNHIVTVVCAITDMKKATAFLNSQGLKDKMTKAGVEAPPSFFYYNVVQKYQ